MHQSVLLQWREVDAAGVLGAAYGFPPQGLVGNLLYKFGIPLGDLAVRPDAPVRARTVHSHALDKGRKTGKVLQIRPLLEDLMDWPADLQAAFHAQDAPVMGRGKFAPRQNRARPAHCARG